MTSTTAIGDAFRDQVVGLLKVAGFDVTSEILVDHKKVDIRFEETSLGRRRRYALEAKNYASPLSKDQLVKIVADYDPLIRTQSVDELFIVSPHPVRSPAANAYLEQNKQVTHRSFLEFQEDVMGFGGYLQYIKRQHEEEGLEQYYIQPTLTDGKQLQTVVDRWLIDSSNQPLAILAAYGMGKTSFARDLAYQLAKAALSGEPSRIPVLLSLGIVSREQSLEGLVASTLVGKANLVKRYSFEAFAALNKLGRFVCFLDGFDEMKHMMSASEFRHNFTELNRLVEGHAKVILLGRPTAFLSDDEKEYVLRGRRPLGDQWAKIPGAPEYRELHLAPFSPSQSNDFVFRYLTHWTKREAARSGKPVDPMFVERRRAEIQAAEYGELVSRPVHARMLAEIATDPKVDLKRVSRYSLYDDFIRLLIDREAAKEGRRYSFTAEERRKFATELAWLLWTTPAGKTLGCRIEDIPGSLFENYHGDGTHDLNAIKRDLVSGSFLEEKTAGVFYIPHRSFQEFLVAEHIAHAPLTSEFLLNHHRHFNSDVVSFLAERDDNALIREILKVLDRLQGQLSVEFLHSFENCIVAQSWVLDTSHPIGPWQVFMAFFGVPQLASAPLINAIGQLVTLGGRTKTIRGLLAAVFCLCLRFEAAHEPAVHEALCRTIIRLLANQLPIDRFRWEGGHMFLTPGDLPAAVTEIFTSSIVRNKEARGNLLLDLDPRELYRKVRKVLIPRHALDEASESGALLAALPEKPATISFNRAFEITATTKSAAKDRIERLREYFIVQPTIVVRENKPEPRN